VTRKDCLQVGLVAGRERSGDTAGHTGVPKCSSEVFLTGSTRYMNWQQATPDIELNQFYMILRNVLRPQKQPFANWDLLH